MGSTSERTDSKKSTLYPQQLSFDDGMYDCWYCNDKNLLLTMEALDDSIAWSELYVATSAAKELYEIFTGLLKEVFLHLFQYYRNNDKLTVSDISTLFVFTDPQKVEGHA